VASVSGRTSGLRQTPGEVNLDACTGGALRGNPYIGAAYADPKVARYWSMCRVLVCWKA
jgi:hypothetical protein